jgi:hypothetical protein
MHVTAVKAPDFHGFTNTLEGAGGTVRPLKLSKKPQEKLSALHSRYMKKSAPLVWQPHEECTICAANDSACVTAA